MDTFTTDFICQWVYNKPKGINNTNRKRVGYVIAAKADTKVRIGWSKCSDYDVFDLERAREIAIGRLELGSNTPLPASFKEFMPEFILRCNKYFQSDDVEELVFYR